MLLIPLGFGVSATGLGCSVSSSALSAICSITGKGSLISTVGVVMGDFLRMTTPLRLDDAEVLATKDDLLRVCLLPRPPAALLLAVPAFFVGL